MHPRFDVLAIFGDLTAIRRDVVVRRMSDGFERIVGDFALKIIWPVDHFGHPQRMVDVARARSEVTVEALLARPVRTERHKRPQGLDSYDERGAGNRYAAHQEHE